MHLLEYCQINVSLNTTNEQNGDANSLESVLGIHNEQLYSYSSLRNLSSLSLKCP